MKKRSYARIKRKLEKFQARVVQLGGSYSRRYSHVSRTKYYLIHNSTAFNTAARELDLELAFREVPWRRGLEVFVLGLTMKGSKDGKHANKAEKNPGLPVGGRK